MNQLVIQSRFLLNKRRGHCVDLVWTILWLSFSSAGHCRAAFLFAVDVTLQMRTDYFSVVRVIGSLFTSHFFKLSDTGFSGPQSIQNVDILITSSHNYLNFTCQHRSPSLRCVGEHGAELRHKILDPVSVLMLVLLSFLSTIIWD